MRKYIKAENLDENTNKALQFFENLIREGIIDYSVMSDIFYELGFQVNVRETYKGDIPGGSITLKWAY